MNVLTIDIDYAFSPMISTYDDHVIGSRISLEEQKNILLGKGFTEPEINHKKFTDLVNVFNNFRSNAKVVLITHHHQILDHIPLHEDINLQNIDHHHDIFYPDWHELEKLDEGNWVYHLSKTNKLKKYTWFKNSDSEPYCDCLDLNFEFRQLVDLSIKHVTKPELIVLCSSPHWTFDYNNTLMKKMAGEDDDN